MDLKGKKVLLMGLGILGGGVATARFLAERGALLTVTDMKTPEFLEPSLAKLRDLPDIKFVLGEHREQDFLENEIIVVNPDVPIDNPFIRLAKDNGKIIENELSLFFKNCQSRQIVGITGTRGKTTTVNWTAHLLGAEVVGNSPENPFLGKGVEAPKSQKLVLEMPSFQLELLGELVESQDFKLAPQIAVITNLYRDHINRHKTMEGYARAKGDIFKYQTENDFLLLNKDNEWTNFFLGLGPKAKTELFSKEDGFEFLDKRTFAQKWGEHNLLNLIIAIRVAIISGISIAKIAERIETLPQIKFRQEKVYESWRVVIYNDTASTSPEATIMAVERFAGASPIVIAGGTDRELEYNDAWGKRVAELIKPENLILLQGSATEKIKHALGWAEYVEFATLEECLNSARQKADQSSGQTTIVFSPGAKSFEKFKNEFDRGEQFNALVKKYFYE